MYSSFWDVVHYNLIPQKKINLQNHGLNVPYLEEEEDVDAVLMVHHDYEGALLGVKQVSDVGNGENLKKLVPP